MTVTGEQLIERVNAGTTEAEIVQYHPDLVTAEVVKGGVKVDHVGGSTARLVAVENRTVLCLSQG